jgi:hypothetical protein
MALKNSAYALGLTALIGLSACGTPINYEIANGGQYWQRKNVSESVYQQGPKAQQMLNRDIARCVTELRELERLGAVKNAIPTDIKGRVLDPDQKDLADWDTPERDQYLFAEQGDYYDFETCMLAKGWERILHVPYDVAKQARENYLDAHVDYRHRSRVDIPKSKPSSPEEYEGFGNVNE